LVSRHIPKIQLNIYGEEKRGSTSPFWAQNMHAKELSDNLMIRHREKEVYLSICFATFYKSHGQSIPSVVKIA
jgi:hypothetical protein